MVDRTCFNEPHAPKCHSVGVSMVMVDCVIIAFIRCKDLLCLLNYMQLYSRFIFNNYFVIIVYIV